MHFAALSCKCLSVSICVYSLCALLIVFNCVCVSDSSLLFVVVVVVVELT